MTFGERFLTLPDLFPARQSGEAWGEATLALDLPGGPFHVDGLNAAQGHVIVERFGPCVVAPSREAPACLRLFRAAGSDFLEIATRGWVYTFDTSSSPRGVRVAGEKLMARVDGAQAALWTPLDGAAGFLQAFENVLRLFVAYRIFDLGGLLLHCSAAVVEGRAYVFVGRSGAGKSTAARLSLEAGRSVLSDDLNALLPDGDAFQACSLPFTGDLSPSEVTGGGFPVARLCRLEQHPSHEIAGLSRAEEVSLLAACAPYLNADPERSGALLDRALAIAASVPGVALKFRKDSGFWEPLLAAGSDPGVS